MLDSLTQIPPPSNIWHGIPIIDSLELVKIGVEDIAILREASLTIRRLEDAHTFLARARELHETLSQAHTKERVAVIIGDAFVDKEKHSASVRFYIYSKGGAQGSYTLNSTQIFPAREKVRRLVDESLS